MQQPSRQADRRGYVRVWSREREGAQVQTLADRCARKRLQVGGAGVYLFFRASDRFFLLVAQLRVVLRIDLLRRLRLRCRLGLRLRLHRWLGLRQRGRRRRRL